MCTTYILLPASGLPLDLVRSLAGALVQGADAAVAQRQDPDGVSRGLRPAHPRAQGTQLAAGLWQLLLRGGQLAGNVQVR